VDEMGKGDMVDEMGKGDMVDEMGKGDMGMERDDYNHRFDAIDLLYPLIYYYIRK
jgi:hypothetical protein